MASSITDSDLQNAEYQETKLFLKTKSDTKESLMKQSWILNDIAQIVRVIPMVDKMFQRKKGISMRQIEAHQHWFDTPYQQLKEEQVETEDQLAAAHVTPRRPTSAPTATARSGVMSTLLNTVRSFQRRTGLRSSPSAQVTIQESSEASAPADGATVESPAPTPAVAPIPSVQYAQSHLDDDQISIRSSMSSISRTSMSPVGPADLDKLRVVAEMTAHSLLSAQINQCPLGRAVLDSANHRFPGTSFPATVLVAMIRQMDATNMGSKLLMASNDLDRDIDSLSQTDSTAAYVTVIRNSVEHLISMIQQHDPDEDQKHHQGVMNAVSIITACRIIDNMKKEADMKTDTHLWVTGTQKQSYGEDIYSLPKLLNYIETVGEHRAMQPTNINLAAFTTTMSAPTQQTSRMKRKCMFCITVLAGNRPNEKGCLIMAEDHEPRECPHWRAAITYVSKYLEKSAA